jgi:hypothetical protein
VGPVEDQPFAAASYTAAVGGVIVGSPPSARTVPSFRRVAVGAARKKGAAATETHVLVGTVTASFPDTPLNVATTVVEPEATAVTTPPATFATVDESLVHVAVAVRSLVLWSEYVPVAVSASWAPTLREGESGVTAMDCRLTGGGGEELEVEPPPPPQAFRLVRTTNKNAVVIELFIISSRDTWGFQGKQTPRLKNTIIGAYRLNSSLHQVIDIG